jgi:ABC-type Na+ efflux pump permease subunit
MAEAARIQVSLVEYISPSDAPVAAAQPSDRVRKYRQPQAIVAKVKNTSKVSWI